ncbi:DUF3592 domain-containing protein [Streptomyces sp. NPDC052040]|uniref:DUF3592 domain-containing protein n=1 Tax=Streptomyces sp. NPDC052040 TaxID=3365682 RepID=UPI0037D85169
MSGLGETILVAGGLLAVGGGLRESWVLWRMRRSGVRADGVVLRHEVTGHNDGHATYAPVVAYDDEHGSRREFRSRLSGSGRKPAEGSRVRVVHLPGRPETARLDTLHYKVTALSLLFGVGAVFLAVALYLW